MSKQNDWIVASLNNPDFSVSDFKIVADMNLDNTLLLPAERYKQSEFILKSFQTNGLFDSAKFDKFYNEQAERFKEFATESEVDNFEYDMWDVTKPKNARIKNPNFTLFKPLNPDHISIGIAGPNVMSESPYSRRELALRSHIKDSITGEDLGKSVNDISFFESPFEYVKSLFEEPLVYAVYESDGFHEDPFTKEMVKHKKGDWKVNEEGEYYTETLGGRSPLGREIVSAGDYITAENSTLDKYDFMDSDGLKKSVTGSIVKNLAFAAPMLFLGPVGATLYGGAFVAREMVKTLPMLYGMYKSFTGLEVEDNALINTLAAYGQKLSGSTSDYAKKHLASVENVANLFGDVVVQFGQQRSIISSFSNSIKGTNRTLESVYTKAANKYTLEASKRLVDGMSGRMSAAQIIEDIGAASRGEVKDLLKTGAWRNTRVGRNAINAYLPDAKAALQARTKMGQNLALAYMALTSNTDVYEAVLAKGGTPLEASAIALGSTLGMFAVDKFLGLGELFFQDDVLRSTYRNAWKKESKDLIDSIQKENGLKIATKKHLTNIIDKSIDKAKTFVQDYHSKIKDKTLGFVGKSIGEGLEEVSEELVSDFSKQLGELAGHLGIFSQTDYGAFEKPFERYMMSFFGGAAGGGLFYGIDAFQRRNEKSLDESENELIYLIRNHKKEDLMKELNDLHKKGKLGSTELSWETTEKDGKKQYITADDKHMSQNDYVYQRLTEVYNLLDAIINGNKVGLGEDELFDQLVLSDTRLSALKSYLQDKSYTTRYLEEFHKIAKALTDKDLEIQQKTKGAKDSDKNNPTYQKELLDLLNEKKELEKLRDRFLNGEESLHYVKKMLFAIDPKLSGSFMSTSPELFAEENFGKKLEDLSQGEMESFIEAYQEHQRKEKENLDESFAIYEELEKELSSDIEDLSQIDGKKELERLNEVLKKYPAYRYLNWDSKLDSESDEEYANRNTKLETEDDEQFKLRKANRQQLIEDYNLSHTAEFIKDFADMGLDSSNYRMMHLHINTKRDDRLDALARDFLKENEDGSVDVEFTKFVLELLKSKTLLSEVEENFRKYVREKAKQKISKKYKGLTLQGGLWDDFKEWNELNADSQLSGNDIMNALYQTKQLYINLGYSPEDATELILAELDGIGFSNTLLNKFKLLLDISEELQAYLLLENAELEKVKAENPESSQANVYAIVSNNLRDYRNSINEKIFQLSDGRINEDFGITVSLPSILDESFFEINDDTFNSNVDLQSEEDFNKIFPVIETIWNRIQSDSIIGALDSLNANLYRNNPALLFLNKITAKFNNTRVNVEDFLQSLHEQYQSLDNFQDFKLNKELVNALKTLKENIKKAKAFLYAASKNVSTNSPIGLNKFINEFIKNHSDVFKSKELLPELDEDLGAFLILELVNYEAEIDEWLKHADDNRVDKISMFKESAEALDKALKSFYEQNKSKFIVNGVNLLEGYTTESTVLDAERLLYDNVLKAIKEGKLTFNEVLDIIPKVVTDVLNISLQIPSKLDLNLKYLNDYDKFTYFVTTICLPIDEYRQTLKRFINENPNIVPISIQMYVGRLLQAMQTNPDDVNAAIKYILNKFKVKLPWLPNTTIVTGVGGSGKSEITGKIATENKGENAWVSGPEGSQIKNLMLPTRFPNATGLLVDDIISKILGETDAAVLLKDIDEKVSNSKFYKQVVGSANTNTYALKNIKFLKVSDLPEVIIIDEATHIPSIKLLIIAEFCRLNGINLNLLGDTSQSGFTNGSIHNLQKEVLFAWRTPKLYLSLRDTNVQKFHNLKGILDLLDPLIDNTSNKASLVEETLEKLSKVKFRYHINDKELCGELITNNLTSDVIDILKSNGDVAFIGNSESPILAELKDAGIEVATFSSIKEIQGLEFDYVVSDLDWNTTDRLSLFLLDLYTVISRSKKGTVLIDNHLSDFIKSKKDLNTGLATDIRDALKDFREAALADLVDIKSPLPVDNTTNPAPIGQPTNPLELPPAEEPPVNKKPEEPPTNGQPEEPPVNKKPATNNNPLEPKKSLEEDSTDEYDRLKEEGIDDETSATKDNSGLAYEEKDEGDEEALEFDKQSSYPTRAYSNIHIIHAKVSRNGSWTGDGSNKDISIFLQPDQTVKTEEEKDRYVTLVLLTKCLLIHGVEEYYNNYRCEIIRDKFSKEALENAEYYLTAENLENNNKLMGLTNLSNKERGIYNKLITIVAKIKDRLGNICTITLGGAAKPKTWEKFVDGVLSNPNISEEERAKYSNIKSKVIKQYKEALKDLQVGLERKIKIETSVITTLIDKDGEGNPNPEIRLLDLVVVEDDPRKPFDNKTRYAVRSPVYTLTEDDVNGLNPNLLGKPVIFVSNNMFLDSDSLKDYYLDYKKGIAEGKGVRMIILSNKGVSFDSLLKLKWRDLYTLSLKSTTLPFELLPMGVRMYISMWNFRANLAKFNDVLSNWMKNPKIFTPNATVDSLSMEDVIAMAKTDRDMYNQAVSEAGHYLTEKEYRDSVKDKSKVQLLWDFNDNLSESVRQFRLGYDSNNGAYIRTLTNIKSDNPFYDHTKSNQGIYIMPNLAKDYLAALNALFDNVINKMIPTDRNPLAWIDKEKSLPRTNDEGELYNWFKSKVKDRSSMSISIIDENNENKQSIIDFGRGSVLKNIPTAMVLISKYLKQRAFDPRNFDARMHDPEAEELYRGIYITDENEKKLYFDYISIATALGLKLTDTEGVYTPGIGLKPYIGESTGTIDRRLDNLFNLMFHGLVTLTEENNFDNPADLRATDAYFKYGFFSDPTAFKGSGNTFALIATNEALFSTNLLPGFPIINWWFDDSVEEETTEETQEETQEEVVEPNNQLIVFKKRCIDVISESIGRSIPNNIFDNATSLEELEALVNAFLNPQLAIGETEIEKKDCKEKSIIHKYFTQHWGTPITKLISSVSFSSDGQIIGKSLFNDIKVVDELPWNNGVKVVIDEEGKEYKVIYNAGKVSLELLSKVDIKSEENTPEVVPNVKNIKFTIYAYIDELLNSVDSSLDEEFKDMINEVFGNLDDEDVADIELTIKPKLLKVVQRLSEYDDEESTEWHEALSKVILIVNEIPYKLKLREGCI